MLWAAGGGVLLGCSDQTTSPAPPRVHPPTEITIQYIHRLPEIDYVWGSTHPATEGWPTPGQAVIWQAHLKSWADTAVSVEYRWELDGAPAGDGTVTIAAESGTTVELPWRWTFDRHTVTFVLDPGNRIAEQSESNNRLLIYTDALAVAFYVGRGFYDFYRQNIQDVAPYWDSLEDWAQAHIAGMNNLFARAVYPETPNGVLDRVRLDKIVVFPAESLQQYSPNQDDRTVDLQWTFPDAYLRTLGNASSGFSPVFGYRPSVLHELGHARYLIDVYDFDVIDGGNYVIGIEEAGQPIVGTPYLPAQTVYFNDQLVRQVYATPEQGLMNSQYSYVDRYSAVALNRIAGHRATYGTWNLPWNGGVFLMDLPAQNRLVLRDSTGAPISAARVDVYRSGPYPPGVDPGAAGGYHDGYFDDVPDLTFQTDAAGRVTVGRDPFGDYPSFPLPDGTTFPAHPRHHVILRVQRDRDVGYVVLESRLFNLAYWRGDSTDAEYTMPVPLVRQP